MKHKKAWIQDFLFFGIMVLIVAFMFIIGTMLMTRINDNIQGSDMSAGAKAISDEQITRFPQIFDNIFIMIFFGLVLSIIAGYYIIQTHPALLFPIVIIFGFILIVIAVQGNVFDKFITHDSIVTTAGQFPATSFIMGNILEIVVVLGFIGIIALFAKSGLGGE